VSPAVPEPTGVSEPAPHPSGDVVPSASDGPAAGAARA
jgi:hypothetical protein